LSTINLMPKSNAIIDVYKTKTNDSGQYSKNDIYTKHGLTVGSLPRGVAVNPITNMTYVANYDSKSISVINGVTNRLVTDIPTGSTAARIAVNPDTNKIYVANCDPEFSSAIDCSSVSVIDGRTNKIVDRIAEDVQADAVAINPKTNKIYLAEDFSNTIYIVDGNTDNITSNITLKKSAPQIRITQHTIFQNEDPSLLPSSLV
jgi:YVTN family beta-propeller protein